MCSDDVDRGVSEVLGYSLIFSLILISIGFVSLGGVDSLESVRDAEQLNNAERAFGVLADNTADIYERDAPSRATELSIGQAELFTGTNSTITISGSQNANPWEANIEVTPIVFRTGNDNKIIYEAGAVFRTRRDAGRIVRPPPLKFGSQQRILTIVATQAGNTQGVSGTDILARMKARNKTVLIPPAKELAPAGGLTNPTITIDSQRADLWLRYLSAQPGTTGCSKSGTTVSCGIIMTSTPPTDILLTVHKIEINLEQ